MRLAAVGGMGAVYEAVDRRSGEKVALKVLLSGRGSDSMYERFAREAKILAELSHPGIVAYVAHGALAPELAGEGARQGGSLYLAMEWLEGRDLAPRPRRARPAPHGGG